MAFTHVIPGTNRHQHDTVEEAMECQDMYNECRAEQEAEQGYERWLESGGEHAAAIQNDLDLDERMHSGR